MDVMLQRFYLHTRRDGKCLMWTGGASGKPGYKRPRFAKQYAHRWIYERLIGPIPDGYQVDHTCKRGLCVEITHLEAVTPAENYRRERLLRCRAGLHDLTDPNNCDWDAKGRRRGCKRCKSIRALAWYYAKKAGQ